MLRKTLAIWLICLIFSFTAMSEAFADSKQDKQSELAEKVKAQVSELGTGENARIEVKLQDKTTLNGYAKETNSESFLLADTKSGAVTTIHYPEVKKLKGYNMSTGKKVAVGVSVSLGIIFVIWLLYASSD